MRFIEKKWGFFNNVKINCTLAITNQQNLKQMKVYLFILSLFFCGISFAQITTTGTIKDKDGMSLPATSITVVGENIGAVSDASGKFTLIANKQLPFDIEISSIGFLAQKVKITKNNQVVNITLIEEENLLDEIVVSASRTPERLRESAVTIERFTAADVKRTASPTFYDGLENMKEVQMNTSSLSFKSINTRGFATVANTRFMQLVDGMDNSSPLLNFVLGNLIGISDIDVASVELLPGASSALYGANAFNGILFMKSKSPFTDEGISAYAKYGVTNQEAAGSNEFYDYGVRVAKKFSESFAAKANFTFMNGTDWYATDYSDLEVAGRDRTDPSYNGINVYGDEAVANLKSRQPFGSTGYNLLPNIDITRTGYNETDLTESKVQNAKADISLHFKPFKSDFEVILQSKYGFGNSIYQGASRYNLNGFKMQQHKVELVGKNFFVRAYMTSEEGGESYDMTFTALNINRKWKSDTDWFTQYGGAYSVATLGLVPNVGSTPKEAHAYARSVADTGRFLPGSPEFIKAFNEVIADPDILTGSRLVDNSKIYHSDVNYNFKDLIDFAEIQAGGSYRRYDLNSFGRIYTDTPDLGGIKYDEYGVYTQVQKKLMEDKLKLAASVRYDKADNFDGNVSPRISAVYSAGEYKNHTFRGSFQTGFRNPTTQDQYIGFNIGNRVLIGSAPDNLTRFSETLPISSAGGNGSVTLNGESAYYNSFTKDSFLEFDSAYRSGPPSGLADAALLLERANTRLVKSETVKSFDLGYRGNVEGFLVDINGYYNLYNDFIGNVNVITPYYGTATTSPDININTSANALANRDYREYQLYTNTDLEISSFGVGVGVTRKVFKNYEVTASYNYAQFNFDQAEDPNFEAGFNTPKHRVKGSIGNDNLFKNFGVNVSARWSDEYLWESTFANGMIAAATVVDAQISYGIKAIKSILKVGATNIGGKEYRQVVGPGLIGQQYFVSLTVNP